jgi:hypothetical protein
MLRNRSGRSNETACIFFDALVKDAVRPEAMLTAMLTPTQAVQGCAQLGPSHSTDLDLLSVL